MPGEQRLSGIALPFQEAISFFRQKLNLPSQTWRDVLRAEHDHAFVVAGAMKAELLSDFRAAVNKAISEGKTLEWFQEQFDSLVQKHGWSYVGTRTWRAKVIMGTNLRSSYAAGRYAQLTEPEFLARNPYWEWRHGDSARPRPQHLAWHGMVLSADHAFWQTHFPPAGWGCKCKVFPLSKADVKAEGLKLRRNPPKPLSREPAKGEVLPGVDEGWDYTPGASVAQRVRQLVRKKAQAIGGGIGADLQAALQSPQPGPLSAQDEAEPDR